MTPIAALAACLLLQHPSTPGPERPPLAPGAADVVASLEAVMADAIARAEPSVVAIHRKKGPNPNETTAVRGREPQNPFADGNVLDLQNAIAADDFVSFDFGSGVVIGGDGEILTAFHVVRGAQWLWVRAAGGQAFPAEVIAADPRSDLAVIAPAARRLAERPHLRPIPIGDATRLRKGSFVIALGNSFNAARNDGRPSASWGIVANFARRLELENDGFGMRSRPLTLQNYPTLLQLDARLNLGMSGGAVINLKGELVGLTTTAASPSGFDAQAGYAIPMDRLGRRAVDTLKQGKEVEYGLLGIKSDPTHTNRVMAVTRNSPAGRGNILINDEILAVNGTPIADFDGLILAINVFSPGDSVRLRIRRSQEVIERTVVLAKYPTEGEVIATNRPAPWRGLRVDYTSAVGQPVFGPDLMDLTAAGVVVTEVQEPSPAAAAGIKKGILILRVAGKPVLSPRSFHEAVDNLEGPVALETDIGLISVGTLDAPRSQPAGPPAAR